MNVYIMYPMIHVSCIYYVSSVNEIVNTHVKLYSKMTMNNNEQTTPVVF